MRKRNAGWAGIALVLCFGGVFAQGIRYEITDKEITEKIIGKWSEDINDDQVKGKANLEYKKDGTMTGDGTLEVGGQNIKFTIECKWKVENGELAVTFVKITPEGLIPPGTVSKDKILTIDDKGCTYRDEKGKERKMTRVRN